MRPMKKMTLLMALIAIGTLAVGCDPKGRSSSSGNAGSDRSDGSRVIRESRRPDGTVVRYVADNSGPAGPMVVEETQYPGGQVSQTSMSQEDYRRLRGQQIANSIKWGTSDPDEARMAQQRWADQQQQWQRQAQNIGQQFGQAMQQAQKDAAQQQDQSRQQAQDFGRQVNNFLNGLQNRR